MTYAPLYIAAQSPLLGAVDRAFGAVICGV
jgi:hypothetical protein